MSCSLCNHMLNKKLAFKEKATLEKGKFLFGLCRCSFYKR
ncbi:hypothetical protein DB41_IQ00020 [Neochlamydia sp. TUME1]|nr:hypothetical protein DB41_IQ00020 [Neochlamydia sp. TUME1]